MNLGLLFLVLALGALAGFGLRRRPAAVRINALATRGTLWTLLFFMGTRLGAARHILGRDLGLLGWAVASSALLVLLSFLPFLALGRRRDRPAEAPEGEPARRGGELTAVLLNGGCIALGFLLALLLPAGTLDGAWTDRAADWSLRLLLFLVGFDLGAEIQRLDLRKLPPPLLLLPFLNIALTLGCGLLFALLRGLPLRQGMLLYAGMGWYSLSSVLLAQKGLTLLALLAFIHNVFRELFSILTAPLAARVSPYLPIHLGGATSMDVMLPFVQRYCGRDFTLVSFYSGLVCSLAVPPLVRALL
jgi:uncharacterized membrane protein YbjE (DUF340 family)